MKVSVNVIDVNDSEKLRAQVEKRVEKLKHVYDEILSAEVIIKKNKAIDPSPKTVEMRVHVAVRICLPSKESTMPEEAIDLAFEALSKQLIKFKETKR